MSGTITDDPPPACGGSPLIVTEDAALLDDLLRLCAAAGATPEVHHGVPDQGDTWAAAPLVLVGDDAAHRLLGAARRRQVVLIGRDQDDPDVWRRGMEIGALARHKVTGALVMMRAGAASMLDQRKASAALEAAQNGPQR